MSQTPMMQNRLAFEVAVVVAVKTAIVVLAAIFVFGARQRPSIDPAMVVRHLLAQPTISAAQKEIP